MASAQWDNCTHAIVVCGHAIFVGGRSCSPSDAALDKSWMLQSFQSGEGVYYLRHVREHGAAPCSAALIEELQRGVELAAEDADSLLILSGGQTRFGCHQSEGQSYYELALVHGFWGHASVVAERTTTEDFARDSYENVVFGIARFRECTGRYPERLTVVSWRFKEKRFRHHAMSIRWPISELLFRYEAVCNPLGDALIPALAAEERTLEAFRKDPTGSMPDGPLLAKRQKRNPYKRHHGYGFSCPELTRVLIWKGVDKIPVEMVPWQVVEDGDEQNA